jgi:hypothetical protein
VLGALAVQCFVSLVARYDRIRVRRLCLVKVRYELCLSAALSFVEAIRGAMGVYGYESAELQWRVGCVTECAAENSVMVCQ